MPAEALCDGVSLPLDAASPQHLRLALIEGALHFARQTEQAWEASRPGEGLKEVGRCRRILSELVRGTRPDQSPLTRKVAALYLFLFRELVAAQLDRDLEKLGEIISVLEVERETWRLVCDEME